MKYVDGNDWQVCSSNRGECGEADIPRIESFGCCTSTRLAQRPRRCAWDAPVRWGRAMPGPTFSVPIAQVRSTRRTSYELVSFVGGHDAGYLDHCRRYAIKASPKGVSFESWKERERRRCSAPQVSARSAAPSMVKTNGAPVQCQCHPPQPQTDPA